jgi:thiamine pyrophosphate-dependent acetolactate synthase large subunit-like protein
MTKRGDDEMAGSAPEWSTSSRDVPTPMPIKGESPRTPEFGSDVIVDLLRSLDIEYVSMVPGSSFRGIHDSLVNYGGNTRPTIVLAIHESTAVAIAQGYYKASGKIMGVLLHNVVGLQAGVMSVYNAWCDRVPVLILGGTGPLDVESRRKIDWTHTALIQGTVVRDITKWDAQPSSIGSFADAVLRAHRIAVTEPSGPVYVCFDASLQEAALVKAPTVPDVSRYVPAPPPAPNADALARAARTLVASERPLILADRACRHHENFEVLERLAELLGAAMHDGQASVNFRSDHPQNLSGDPAIIAESDVVLAVDVEKLHSVLQPKSPRDAYPSCVIAISLDELLVRGWANQEMLPAVDVPILADARVTLPLLYDACRRLIASDQGKVPTIEGRKAELSRRQARLHASWREHHVAIWDSRPISRARWASELWEVIKDLDWAVVASPSTRNWGAGIWKYAHPSQYLGSSGGGGLGYILGAAVGAALALKGTGKLPIAVIGDGEFLMSSSALWTAAHCHVPLLVVIHNNASFRNDFDHQAAVASARGRPPGNAGIGINLDSPSVDLAQLARAFSQHAEGPISDPGELAGAFRRAVDHIMSTGGTAVVEVMARESIVMVGYPPS